jgi:hypothetical protein
MNPVISSQYANVLFFVGMSGVVVFFLGLVLIASIVEAKKR